MILASADETSWPSLEFVEGLKLGTGGLSGELGALAPRLLELSSSSFIFVLLLLWLILSVQDLVEAGSLAAIASSSFGLLLFLRRKTRFFGRVMSVARGVLVGAIGDFRVLDRRCCVRLLKLESTSSSILEMISL